MAVEFVIEECTRRAALNAVPVKKTELSLDRIAETFPALASSRHVLVVELDEEGTRTEVIVHTTGKLIFKQCHDKGLAKRLAERIYEVGTE